MPSDDVILNLKQISGYPQAGVSGGDEALLQRGGLGGPYYSVNVQTLVGQGLAGGGPLYVGAGALAGTVPAPAPNTVLADVFTVMLDGFIGWNAYWSNAAQADFRVVPGTAAGQIFFDNQGWTFAASTDSSQPVAWSHPLNISTTGYLTVADQVVLGRDPMLPMEAATSQYVQASMQSAFAVLNSLYANATVWSFNQRTGNVILCLNDILGAGGAPIFSPSFQGTPTAPTPPPAASDGEIVTAQWVLQAIAAGAVSSFNGRTGAVTLTSADIVAAGGLSNPNAALTGVPTAPTAAALSNNSQIATTQYVDSAITNVDLSNYAPLLSPNFTGSPTAPTAPNGADDGRIATTAFVHNAVVAATTGVSSFNTRTGAVTLVTADITGAGGAALASPVFTGVPQAPTATAGTNTQQIATTAFVTAALAGGSVVASFNTRVGAVTLSGADITGAGGALLASPALTGTPTAPTATAGTSTTQIATTAFVANAIAAVGTVVSSFNGRSGAVSLIANDISAAGGAVLASPAFSGTPTAPTAAPGTNTAQIATTSFVAAAITAGLGVSSFNGRTGAVTLQGGDVSGAGGALLASPTFTGTPSGPTAAVSTSTTQLATTAFVQAALGAGAVTSFNTRTGAVTLSPADITAAGGAVLASPAFTGTPTAPTAATATNTTQLATTAFVQNAINAIGAGVVSFNGRTGAVSLITNDISAAGGAVLASPAFTGTPTAPTPVTTDNSTTLATTAFVKAAIGGPYVPLAGGSGNAMTGGLYTTGVNVSGASFPNVTVNKTANSTGSVVQGQRSAVNRWALQLGDNTTESGTGNTGSNFVVVNYTDAGAVIGNALQINRANSQATFGGYVTTTQGYLNRSGLGGSTNAGNVWNIDWVGGLAHLWIDSTNQGSFAYTSDYRTKKDVRPLAGTWEKVKALRPVSYTQAEYQPPGSQRERPMFEADDVERWGFVAHELQETLIESAASGVKDAPDFIQSPNPFTIIACLARALQEAMERIEAIEARIA